MRDLESEAVARAGKRQEFAGALKRKGPGAPIRFICEIKRASPSKGVLNKDLDPAHQAALYRKGNAAAISVVTEPKFFEGSDEFLQEARNSAPELPLLRKDFHVHELQILEAAAGEADAVLLLANALSPRQLKDYLDMSREFQLDHLVEVGDLKEATVAIKAGAVVIGINNRDLTTFKVDTTRTGKILPVLLEAGVITVAESGIHDRETVLEFEHKGLDAVLIGEALITAVDPGQKLRELQGLENE